VQKIRPAAERGHFTNDWLNSYHTFSFSTYHDPDQMGFRQLRVINEDRVQAQGGFPLHPHQDMEILSLVLSGELKHEDSGGNSEVIPAGGVQLISAGTGVQHSEYNPSDDEAVHFLQIWILPERNGLEPGYQFSEFDLWGRPDSFTALANRDGRDGAVTIHQDVSIDYLTLSGGGRVEYDVGESRHAWIQIVAGVVNVNGLVLQAGDGVAVSNERIVDLSSNVGGELLFFDLG